MIRLINILNEIITENLGYGYVKLQLDSSFLNEFQKQIDKDDLNTKGIEDDPHITLLYGLHSEVTEEQVKNKLKDINILTVDLFNLSIFPQSDKDVLKFDTKNSNLFKANKVLKELPYTSDFPNYHPHVTIAYLKKDLGKKYINLFKNKILSVPTKGIVYKNANKQVFNIK